LNKNERALLKNNDAQEKEAYCARKNTPRERLYVPLQKKWRFYATPWLEEQKDTCSPLA
jgi:hypothetical protein